MLFESWGHRILKTKDIAKLFLWMPKVLLKLVMLWPEKGMNLLLIRACYIFQLSISLFIGYGFLRYTITYKDQFDKFAYGLCICIIPILHFLKGPAMCYNIKKMELLVEQVMQYFWPYDLLGGHSQKYIESLFSHINTLQLSFFLVGSIYIVTILLSPILSSTERSLPFPAKFDFDYTVSPTYEIIYFVQCFFLIFLAADLGLGVDLIVLAMCACAASQFRLIGHCFSLLGTPVVKNVNHKLDNMFTDEFCREQNENKKLLIRCVKHQVRLFRFVKDVNEAFNFIELGQLLLGVFGVCLNAFILSSNATFLQSFMASLLAIGFVLQLFLDCTIGSELSYQANLTPDYLFKSDWWSLDTQLKKDIAFVLQHSQRVQQLSAYKLYDMNMTSWMKVHVSRITPVLQRTMSLQSKCGCPLTPTIESKQDFPTNDTQKTFSKSPGLRRRNVTASSYATVNDQTAGTTRLSTFSQTNLSRSPGFSIKSHSSRRSPYSSPIKIISGNITNSKSSTNINHPPNSSTAVSGVSKLSSIARSTPDLRSISRSSSKIVSPSIKSSARYEPARKLTPTSKVEYECPPSNKMAIPQIRLNFDLDAESTRF